MCIKRYSILPILATCLFGFSACAGGNDSNTSTTDPSQQNGNPVESPQPGSGPLPQGLLQTVLSKGVPENLVREAFTKYEEFRGQVHNSSYIALIDFDKHSSENRLFIINTLSGDVDALPMAHGSGSDPDNDGYATLFSNMPNSHKSSIGTYIIGEVYQGKYGSSLKLDGLEPSNSLVRDRSIVLHPAKYVEEGKTKQGRSWGCPAVPFNWIARVISRLRDGSFMYAFSTIKADFRAEYKRIERLMVDPSFRFVNESEDAPFDGE